MPGGSPWPDATPARAEIFTPIWPERLDLLRVRRAGDAGRAGRLAGGAARRLRRRLAHPSAAGVRAGARHDGGRAGQPEGRADLLRSAAAGEAFSTAHRRRPVGLSGGSAPFLSHQENRQGRARRLRHVVRIARRSRAGAGRLRPNLDTSLHQVRRDSAMAQLLTVRAEAAQLAVSRSSVYKLLEGGVFPQAPVRLPNGSPRWPQEVVDDWVKAHRLPARRDCSATATRSRVLQARRGADALRGRSPDCEGATHGRSQRRAARP